MSSNRLMWSAFNNASDTYFERYHENQTATVASVPPSSGEKCSKCTQGVTFPPGTKQLSKRQNLTCEACCILENQEKTSTLLDLHSAASVNVNKRAKTDNHGGKIIPSGATASFFSAPNKSSTSPVSASSTTPNKTTAQRPRIQGLKRDWVVILQVEPGDCCGRLLKACEANCAPQVHRQCFQRPETLHFTLHKQKMTDAEAAAVCCTAQPPLLPRHCSSAASEVSTAVCAEEAVPLARQPLVLQLGDFKDWPTCLALSTTEASALDLRRTVDSLGFAGLPFDSTNSCGGRSSSSNNKGSAGGGDAPTQQQQQQQQQLNQLGNSKSSLHLSLYRLRGVSAAVAKPEFERVRTFVRNTFFFKARRPTSTDTVDVERAHASRDVTAATAAVTAAATASLAATACSGGGGGGGEGVYGGGGSGSGSGFEKWAQQSAGGGSAAAAEYGERVGLFVYATRLTLKVVGSEYDDCRVLATFKPAGFSTSTDSESIGFRHFQGCRVASSSSPSSSMPPSMPPSSTPAFSSSSSSSSSLSSSSECSSSGELYLPAPPLTVQLGGRVVNAIGLGTLPLGVTYSGGGRPARKDAVAVIHAALDAGVNFFDTADSYCEGPGDEHYAEALLRDAFDVYFAVGGDGGGSGGGGGGEMQHDTPQSGDNHQQQQQQQQQGEKRGVEEASSEEKRGRWRFENKIVVATKGGMARVGQSARGWAPRQQFTPEALKRLVRKQQDVLYGHRHASSGRGLGERGGAGTEAGHRREEGRDGEEEDRGGEDGGRGRGNDEEAHTLPLPPIDLWQFHHTDGFSTKEDDDEGSSSSPTSASSFRSLLQACAELVEEGVLNAVGLSNCSLSHLELAQEVLGPTRARGVASVQNHFSLWDRAAERAPKRSSAGAPVAKSNKNGLLEACAAQGIPFIAHGALGGHQSREGKRNLARDFPLLAALACSKGISPHCLLLGWVRHKWPHVVHIAGARTVAHVQDIAKAGRVRFTKREFNLIGSL